jgi:LacI family gluconate utilization system Gnt-I transcriptional repressor
MAQGVMIEAQCRGLRIPQDLAVCGFGNSDSAPHLSPSLTTVSVDGRRMGELAATMLVDRCQGVAVSPSTRDVGFQIVERESTQSSST